MEEVKKERSSNIELLRVISILLIIISHALPYGGDDTSFINLSLATDNIQNLIMIFFKYCGQIGNAIFIVCSAYFLLDSKKVNVKKVITIILDTTIISWIFLLIFYCLRLNIDIDTLLNYAFPTIFDLNYWFIGCYILYYLIHPLLNLIIDNINQKQLLSINIILVILYCIINLLIESKFYYTELVGFILIYFLIAYQKKYLSNISKSLKINFWILIVSLYLLLGFIIIINMLGLNITFYNNKMLYWCKIYNPFIILIAITLFNIVKKINFKSKLVNYLASLSLIVYAVTDNYLLRTEIRPLFFLKYYRS